MNNYFKKNRLIIFLVSCILVLGYIFYGYAKLSRVKVPPVPEKTQLPERGSIVDRSGSPLAVQTNFYHIGINVKQAKSKSSFPRLIAPALEMNEAEVASMINSSEKNFIYLRKKVDENTYKAVKDVVNKNNFNFVSFEKIPGRIYPDHSLASQLIGYMGDDGKGLAGIEFSEQEILSPKQNEDSQVLVQGNNIYLTIDANLQYKLEQIAQETMESTQAESMMLLAADAKNGELLSYISLPSADLNDYGSSPSESKIDRPAVYAYEPGSVFKIFTVGLAYDEGKISPNDSFLCDGVYEKKLSSGETVRIKCLEHHGWITPRDALRYSCNDALAQISDRFSDDDFITRIRQLGFGQKTGIELPSETSGSVKDTTSRLWSARSKQTMAIGQEISVSALQMVQAATAIANGGVPVKLTIIHKVTDKEGSVLYEHTTQTKEQVMSKTAADYVLSCMETTAKTGTGAKARLNDVSIGVKTGTAQMADKVNGGYSDTDFLSNCISIFPVDNPQIILYIVVVKAKGETYAGRIVAPVIAKAADTIIDHLGMSRGGAASLEHDGMITIPAQQAINLTDTVPDFTGLSMKDLMPLFERQDIKLNIKGSGWVVSQNPEPGTPYTENMTIELYLK